MISSDSEGRLASTDWDESRSFRSRVSLISKNIGELVLDRIAGVTAEFKLSTGLDATSPFTPRESKYLSGQYFNEEQYPLSEE